MSNKKSKTKAPTAPVVTEATSEQVAPKESKSKRLSLFKLSRKTLPVYGLIILLLGTGVYALVNRQTTKVLAPAKQQKLAGDTSLLEGRTLVRYKTDDAYEKNSSGQIKTVTIKDEVRNVRQKSFSITLEKDNKTQNIVLDSSVFEFGATNDGRLYALSCSTPERGEAGFDNPSFTVQFYDTNGKKLTQTSWHQEDVARPAAVGQYCQPAPSYFNVKTDGRPDFTPRGYGRVHVDDINYKVVFAKADGSLQDVDTETDTDIDVPLGSTPDKKLFLYNRVSAKRTEDGCGSVISLPYKVVDYSGLINELHAVDLTTGTDTLVGTEASFGVDKHRINLSQIGYFSIDSARYYLVEGTHVGCGMGESRPIRIAYIDLKTMKLGTISSPAGKEYADYCFSRDGKYILESGVVDDYNDKTPPKAPDVPTVLDSSNNITYQLNEATDTFQCDGGITGGFPNSLPNTFTRLVRDNAFAKSDYTKISLPLKGLEILDPSTRAIRKVTFTTPIDHGQTNSVFYTNDPSVGYVLSARYDSGTAINATTLFNFNTGKTLDVPYAQIVL